MQRQHTIKATSRPPLHPEEPESQDIQTARQLPVQTTTRLLYVATQFT